MCFCALFAIQIDPVPPRDVEIAHLQDRPWPLALDAGQAID